jgi:hypothetical protein
MTTLSNLSLADQFFAADAAAKAAQKIADDLKAQLKDLGLSEIEGEFCVVTVKTVGKDIFKADKAKKLLTPAQIKACTETTFSNTLTVKAKVPALLAAAAE